MSLVFAAWNIASAADAPLKGVMQNFEKEIQAIFDQTKDSVVQIKTIVPVADPEKRAVREGLLIGTGFFADNKGHIFTAASVLAGSTNAVVYWRGKTYLAQSLGEDLRTNLALLKIDAETPMLKFGDPDSLKVGSLTLAVGYPMDAPISAEYGFVSNKNFQAPLFLTSHIRSSICVQPGQSGSPLLNSKGEVVGMVVRAMLDGSSTFALPIPAAQKIQRDLMAYHKPRYGWTGMAIEVKEGGIANGKVPIADIERGGPAHLAGISSGDILLKIGEKSIHTAADVMNATFYLSIGEDVDFTIERQGEVKVIPVKVASRPPEKEILVLRPTSTSPLRE